MPRPDGGLIRENNLQYYAGAQIIYTSVATDIYNFTFNTKLVLGSSTSWNPNDPDFALNNFRSKGETTEKSEKQEVSNSDTK